jgi:hypothetical protein
MSFPVIGSIKTFADVKRALDSLRLYFISQFSGSVSSDATAKRGDLVAFGVNSNTLVDSGIQTSKATDAVNRRHTQQHALNSTSDHTSSIVPGKLLKADANGLPAEASKSDAEIAAAISAIGNWTLLNFETGDVGNTLDTTRHVSVRIGGILVKLAVIIPGAPTVDKWLPQNSEVYPYRKKQNQAVIAGSFFTGKTV